MARLRTDLDQQLDTLAQWMPNRFADADQATRLDVFEDALDTILRQAALADRQHVWARAQSILRENGLPDQRK